MEGILMPGRGSTNVTIRLFTAIGIFAIALSGYAYGLQTYTKGTSQLSIIANMIENPEEWNLFIENVSSKRVYTPQCLTDCHLPLVIKYNGSLAPNNVLVNLNKFQSHFLRFLDSDSLNVTYEFLVNETFTTTVNNGTTFAEGTNITSLNLTDFNATHITVWNGTTTYISKASVWSFYAHETLGWYTFSASINTYKNVTDWRYIWKPLNTVGSVTLNKNQYYSIDIIGKRKASTNSSFVDIVPTFNFSGTTFNFTEMAWWNSSWSNCKNISLTEGNYAARLHEPVNVNLTGLSLGTNNCTKEIRIVNAGCNIGDSEIPSQITNNGGQALGDGSEWCKVLFLANATKNAITNYSVYYGNSGATAPTYTKTTFNQTTCPLTFNAGYFSGTMDSTLGQIVSLTTSTGISLDFSSEKMWSTTQGDFSGCTVIENDNVRSVINVTQSDFWANITLYQNAEQMNYTIGYTSANYYLGANWPNYATSCSNVSNAINCAAQNAQYAVSERWFSTNNSNAVVHTGWSSLGTFYRYDTNGRKVWFYDGASQGVSGSSLYFGASNQTTGWQYARGLYLANLNPLTTSVGSQETVSLEPTYSNVNDNSSATYPGSGDTIKMYALWSDDSGLSGYIFSWNNSGSWANDTWVSNSVNNSWTNITKQVTALPGTTVGWQIYHNDSTNLWNGTGTQAFLVLYNIPIYQWLQVVFFNNTHVNWSLTTITINNQTSALSSLTIDVDANFTDVTLLSIAVGAQVQNTSYSMVLRPGADGWFNLTAASITGGARGTSNTITMLNPIDPPSKGGVPDLSFTITLPIGVTFVEFNMSENQEGTQYNVTPTGQTASIPIYTFTNTGSVAEHWKIIFNQSLPSSITMWGDTDNAIAGAKSINNTLTWSVNTSIAVGLTEEMWAWSDFVNAAPGDTIILKTNHTSSEA